MKRFYGASLSLSIDVFYANIEVMLSAMEKHENGKCHQYTPCKYLKYWVISSINNEVT